MEHSNNLPSQCGSSWKSLCKMSRSIGPASPQAYPTLSCRKWQSLVQTSACPSILLVLMLCFPGSVCASLSSFVLKDTHWRTLTGPAWVWSLRAHSALSSPVSCSGSLSYKRRQPLHLRQLHSFSWLPWRLWSHCGRQKRPLRVAPTQVYLCGFLSFFLLCLFNPVAELIDESLSIFIWLFSIVPAHFISGPFLLLSLMFSFLSLLFINLPIQEKWGDFGSASHFI